MGELEGIKRAAKRFPNSEIRTDSEEAKRRFDANPEWRNGCTVTLVEGHDENNDGIQWADQLARNGFIAESSNMVQ